MDLTTFRVQFPEFARTTSDVLVTQMLTAATEQLDPGVWGSTYDQGHGYLTAALLSASPSGQSMARVTGDQTHSTYQVQFDRLRAQVAVGLRVFG